MLFESLERGLMWLTSYGVGADVDSYCQLRAPIDAHTFVTEGNSLLTMYRVVGSRRHIGEEEFDSQTQALCLAITGLLKSNAAHGDQHSVCFGFRSNPAGGQAVLRSMLGPQLMSARRLGADVDFLFEDRLAAMSPACVEEIAVFGVMTHTGGLTPSEKEKWNQLRQKQFEALAKAGISIDKDMSQSPLGPPSVMLSRHNAALQTLETKIGGQTSDVQVMLDRLSCHEAVSVMRSFLDASTYQPNWRPTLLGDRPVGAQAARATRTIEHALPMTIGRQIVTEPLREKHGDAEMVKRGKYFYASVTLDVAPSEDPTPAFSELAGAIGNRIPWQVHFEVIPKGLGYNQMERFLAGMFGSAGEHNRAVKAGMDALKQMQASGRYVAAMRAVFTTWAERESDCVDNVSLLKSSVEGWGQSVASNEIGAPGPAFLASCPGFPRRIPASVIPGPLDAFSRMAPMFRPSSIWKSGQLILFTREGRPYPIYLGSPQQNFWGTLVFAPTGSGKSFLMNMLNSGILFTPGITELPMVTIIDKGPSAKGTIELARAVLPPHVAEQVAYWRPTPTDVQYTVNPFDTQLGCDIPLQADKDFLAALMGGIASNLGPEGGKFIGRVIDVCYEYYARKSPTAKKWQWSLNEELSEKLPSVGINFNEEKPPRVWEVVDAFFRHGMIAEAGLAQYHAVPVMSDVTQILNDGRVRDLWADASMPGSQEKLIKVFERAIISAASEYRLFFGVTRHHSNARFIVVDIEGIASAAQSEEGARRFGLMMLFARRLGARNFFLHPDDIRDVCPKEYREYQLARVQKIREAPKFLEYDEIHNAKGIGAVQALLQKDAREGRKYNVVAVLSSQDLSDFPEDLVKNSYNFFILGAGNAASAADLKRTFDLNDSEVDAILKEITGPGKLFGMFRTNRGMLSQLLVTKPSPRELWAFSTSAADMELRDSLYRSIGARKTLAFLSSVFPGGSAREYIDNEKSKMGETKLHDGGLTEMVLRNLKHKLDEFLAKNP